MVDDRILAVQVDFDLEFVERTEIPSNSSESSPSPVFMYMGPK